MSPQVCHDYEKHMDGVSVIDVLTNYLSAELVTVEQHIDTVLESDTALMREVAEYVIRTRGKRLRPMLAILAAKAAEYDGPEHTKVAAAMELVHTATLLHDDVIDHAPLRRSLPSVNKKWGDDVAILIGDYLYTKAFDLALQTLSPRVLTVLCDVTAKMCEGEMFVIERRNTLINSEEYLRIVRCKTAYLFSACTTLGGMVAGADTADTARLGQFGMDFGIAFQITDDTLDMIADDANLGKQQWTDIRNGKQTLPLIHTLEVAEPHDRDDLLKCWNDGRDAQRIMGHINKYRGIEYSIDMARQYAAKAKEQLLDFKPSRSVELFRQLADYVVDRTY